jgi:hypothetical protein
MGITLSDYVAHKNPKGASRLLKRFGYPASHDKYELAENLKDLVRNRREDALVEIGKIHPDKDLVLSIYEDQSTIGASEQMNFAGLSGEEYVQNLRTNTYWNKNNPQRPLPPDFFYDFANNSKETIKEQVKEEVNKELSNKPQLETKPNFTTPTEAGVKFTTTHLVILASALFVGYTFLKANRR